MGGAKSRRSDFRDFGSSAKALARFRHTGLPRKREPRIERFPVAPGRGPRDPGRLPTPMERGGLSSFGVGRVGGTQREGRSRICRLILKGPPSWRAYDKALSVQLACGLSVSRGPYGGRRQVDSQLPFCGKAGLRSTGVETRAGSMFSITASRAHREPVSVLAGTAGHGECGSGCAGRRVAVSHRARWVAG